MAALGQRECDDGTQKELSPDDQATAREQAARVNLMTLLIAAGLTAIVWLL